MYTLKSNGNFTIVINDIHLTVMPEKTICIDDETYESSSDIKRLEKFLIISNDNEIVNHQVSKVEDKTTNESIFVAHENETVENKDIFIKKSNEDSDVKEIIEQKVEEVKIETETKENEVQDIKIEEVVSIEKEIEQVIPENISSTEDDKITINENKNSIKNKEEKKQKGRPKKK